MFIYLFVYSFQPQAQTNGFKGPPFGVKVSGKTTRTFSDSQIADGKLIIPMQAGTNRVPSQSGMSPYGFSRQVVPSGKETVFLAPDSTRVISLQYGTNAQASQKGMSPYGLNRQIISSSNSARSRSNRSSESSNSNSMAENGNCCSTNEEDTISGPSASVDLNTNNVTEEATSQEIKGEDAVFADAVDSIDSNGI